MAAASNSLPNITYVQRQGKAQFFNEPLGDNPALKMMLIPAGTFLMGSPEGELERTERESPQHVVNVAAFCMGKYPVSQVQWRFVAQLPAVERELNPDPSCFKGDTHPVESVSWFDVIEFCARLSAYTQRTYRLPSESEWEYACRASPVWLAGISKAGNVAGSGASTPFHFGETITTEVANYRGNDEENGAYGSGPKGEYRQRTTPVDYFGSANLFGLCDMHGNVFEWCQDHWHDNYEGAPTDGSAWLSKYEDAARVIRGGSWNSYPRVCRSAARHIDIPREASIYIGFRVVCSSPSTFQC